MYNIGQMDIEPLNIELVRQDPGSDDCLRACALMLFNYYKDGISKEEVWKKIHVYKKHSGLHGGYPQDFGRLAIKRGYRPTIYHYDWTWWDKTVVEATNKNKKSLLSALNDLKKNKKEWSDKKMVNKDIKYVKAGGQFIFQVPSLEIVDDYLQKRIPVLLLVKSKDFFKSPKKSGDHFILVKGKKDNDYVVNDPALAIDKVHSRHLLFSWSNSQGWMMTIVPDKDRFGKRDKDDKEKSSQKQLQLEV